METINLTASPREALGTTASKKLRAQALLPGVLYSGNSHVHFHVPVGQLKPLIYTSKAYFVHLHLADKTYTCILQEVQRHPVSEMLLHADFLEIFEDQPLTMHIPLRLQGDARGVLAGGMLAQKVNKVRVRALPPQMPAEVHLDVRHLELGQSARVRDIAVAEAAILDLPSLPVVTVQIPRALRSKAAQEAAS